MMLAEKMMQLLPKAAGKFLRTRSTFQKALTPLMILHGISPVETQSRNLTTKAFTKNIELISNSTRELKTTKRSPFQLSVSSSALSRDGDEDTKPLSVLLCWLMSQKKHVMKYAQFYLDQGFDVLTVRITPWQLLFPTSGSQLIAKDLLTFMTLNKQYQSTILHGFSVGGYLWGEVLSLMKQDPVTCEDVVNRIVGQIWDSVVDMEGIPTGLPKAVFPNNQVLRTSLETYVRYHMAALYNVATRHYLNSSKNFFHPIVRAPSLFLCSMDDPVGTVKQIQKVQDTWENNGIKVYLKAWNSSPHVSHLHRHPEEYKQEMKAFLEKLGLVPYPEKFALQARA